mgnify:FL=1
MNLNNKQIKLIRETKVEITESFSVHLTFSSLNPDEQAVIVFADCPEQGYEELNQRQVIQLIEALKRLSNQLGKREAKDFQEILAAKRAYYGNTEGAIECAADEYARQYHEEILTGFQVPN